MKRFAWIPIASFVVLATALTAPASRASSDVNFGVDAPLGDDGRLFFSISSRYFDRDERMVDHWGRRFRNPDDLAVFLHLSAHSRMSPDDIYGYRQRGMSWYDVGLRAGVPVEVWYVGPYANPPRYGRKHYHGPPHAVRYSDRECRDFVAVRMAHGYYGVSPEVAMNWRHEGRDVRTIMTREYRTRHGNDHRGRGSDGYHDKNDHKKYKKGKKHHH